MTSATPTILSIQTDSAWVVILAVSIATLPTVLLLRRLIRHPGGLAAAVVLTVPLVVPLLAAALFHNAALPEIAILRPAASALLKGSGEHVHLLLLSHGRAEATLYALSGSAGTWVPVIGALLSSFMLLRRFFGHIRIRRLVRRCRTAQTASELRLLGSVAALAERAGLDRTPDLYLCPVAGVGAFAIGGKRGGIVISDELVECLEPDEIQAILAHEIAHIHARDVQVMVGAGVLRDAMAWNPLAHIALRRLAGDRELEADRRAARLVGSPLVVASALLKMCRLARSDRRLRPRPALAFARPEGRVTRRAARLIRLADGGDWIQPVSRAPYVIAALLAAVVGLQVGAQLAGQRGATLAFVWGTPERSEVYVWTPSLDVWESKRARHLQERKALSRTAARRQVVLMAAEQLLTRTVAVDKQDLPKWIDTMAALAKRQRLAAPDIRSQTLDRWEAVRVFSGRAPFGIYRMERLR